MIQAESTHLSGYARGGAAAALVIVGMFLAGERGFAQKPAPTASPARLTVRPHEMASGTQNPATGEYHLAPGKNALDSLERYVVYVPPPCVGARRCPLLLFLQPALTSATEVLSFERPVADKYGILIMVKDRAVWPLEKESPLAALLSGELTAEQFAVMLKKSGMTEAQFDTIRVRIARAGLTAAEIEKRIPRYPIIPARQTIDAALKQVLQKFAINPDKIAIYGHCAGSPAALIIGSANQDVFSRIIERDGEDSETYATVVEPPDPKQTTEIYMSGGNITDVVPALRRAGHRIKMVRELRSHWGHPEADDYTGQWLQESWLPAPNRPAPRVIDSLPTLTLQALERLQVFWEGFQSGCREQHCSVLTLEQRIGVQRETRIPSRSAETQSSVVMMDMVAAAARYPVIATLLKKAGLTAEQHDAYRLAVLAPGADGGPNRVFADTHQDELQAPWVRYMLDTP